MDAERAQRFLLELPHVVETMQWGENLVFWVGDKAVGGKMFALMNLDADGKGVIAYAAGAERFAELVEMEGLEPAPYLARAFWVAAERWGVHRDRVWEEELRGAYELTLGKLPGKVRRVLALPARELERVVGERRRALAAKAAGVKAAKVRATGDSLRG